MNLNDRPLLQLQRDLHGIPHGRGRFLKYLARVLLLDDTTVQESEGRNARGWLDWPPPSWTWLLMLGLLSRVAVVAWGDHRARLGPPETLMKEEHPVSAANHGYNARHLAALEAPRRSWVAPWYRWDALWYAEVSQAGYVYERDRQCTSGFLPLLPMVMGAGAKSGLDRYWVGLVAVNLAFAVGLACFGRATLRATGDRGRAWRACLLLTAYPSSLFFSAPYQESLGFALTSAALLAWLVRRPIAAAVNLALASLARLTTVAMSVALVAEWLNDRLHRRPARNSAWLVALSAGVGFGLFCAYLGVHVGDPLAHLRAHSAWHRQPASARNVVLMLGVLIKLMAMKPSFAIVSLAILAWTCWLPARAGLSWLRTWVLEGGSADPRPAPRRKGRASKDRAGRREKGRDNSPSRAGATPEPPVAGERPLETKGWGRHVTDVVALGLGLAGLSLAIPGNPLIPIAAALARMTEAIAIVLFLGLGVHAWWRRGPFWGCLILLPVVQGMATGTSLSMNRIVLNAFPAFLDLAELLQPRLAFAVWMVASLVAQITLIDSFVNWTFLG